MTQFRANRSIHDRMRLLGVALCCAWFLLGGSVTPARGDASVTWYVTSATDDVTDGDLVTHSGSLRFALAHATSGDFVSFANFDAGVDKIFAGSTLTLPAGVAVGHRRSEDCGNYQTPLVTIEARPLTVNPVFSLGAGSTLRNIDIGGGWISVRISGANADVCGVGLGIESESDLPPSGAALVIDGDHSVIHRNYINGPMVVDLHGSDSRIGDAIGGSGDSNQGGCTRGLCGVTVYANSSGAAQRATIRDPFPRGLAAMPGSGVSGGDDVPTHANNWAQTPTILSAYTYDNFATVQVVGAANPLSLVDVYFDNNIQLTRQTPVTADAYGAFSFSGPLPGNVVRVIVASTLNDPAHPNRLGSSSEFSDPVQVTASVAEPMLNALGSIAKVNGPQDGVGHPGDTLRFTVTMMNIGSVDVTHVHSAAFSLSTGLDILPGTGAVQGNGAGFVATDGGFSGGALAPGQVASYSVDAEVTWSTPTGLAELSLDVNADGGVTVPVSGTMLVLNGSGSYVWLPLVMR